MIEQHVTSEDILTDVKQRLNDAIIHMRDDVGRSDDDQLRALLETSAEVLVGVVTAMEHFERGEEDAWH